QGGRSDGLTCAAEPSAVAAGPADDPPQAGAAPRRGPRPLGEQLGHRRGQPGCVQHSPASLASTTRQPSHSSSRPPVIPRTCPLTSEAASESSHTTTGATLAGSRGSNRPGKRRSPNAPCVIAVRAPGAIAFTRIGDRATPSAAVVV